MSKKGYKQTEEHKRKKRKTEFKKGHIVSEKLRETLRRSALKQFENGMPEKTKRKIKESSKGLNTWAKGKHQTLDAKRKIGEFNKGKHLTEETRKKLRITTFEYAKKVANIICPRVGHNEKQILDKLEQELNYKILRQFEVEGYFIDGYIPELNTAIEVDEKPKNTERDIERQKIIENKLNCRFIRIKDYD